MTTRGIHITILLALAAVPLWAYDLGGNASLGHDNPAGAFNFDPGRVNRAVGALRGQNPCVAAKERLGNDYKTRLGAISGEVNKRREINTVISTVERDDLILALQPKSSVEAFAEYFGVTTGQNGCLELPESLRIDERKDLLVQEIQERRFKALVRFLNNQNIEQAAAELVQWAYLTGEPPMPPGQPIDVNNVIEEMRKKYEPILKTAGTEPPPNPLPEPFKSLSAETKQALKQLKGRVGAPANKLEFTPPEKQALTKALGDLQGATNQLAGQFPGVRPPQLQQPNGQPLQSNNDDPQKRTANGRGKNRGGSPGGAGGEGAKYQSSLKPIEPAKSVELPPAPPALVFAPVTDSFKAPEDGFTFKGSTTGPVTDPGALTNENTARGSSAAASIANIQQIVAQGANRAAAGGGPVGRSPETAVTALGDRPGFGGRSEIGSSLLRQNAGAHRHLSGARRSAAKH